MTKRALVTGAGGFIGHHMVNYLLKKGYWVRGVDIRQPEFEPSAASEFLRMDLRERRNCEKATKDVQEVYHMAADMGGMGYIGTVRAKLTRNNILINTYMLDCSAENAVERFFFSSTACVYAQYKQKSTDIAPLKEEDAHPADPEEGYGWEKLFTEKMCRYYREEAGLETRVARFHNVYGPLGTFQGGREKAPAAVCRKVASAQNGGEIEIWGDGKQTRSFMFIDDCVEGIYRLTQSDYADPLNLGRDEMVSIDELVDIVSAIAGKTLRKRYDLSKPQGVRGRNSDNSRLLKTLGWGPGISLKEGLARTYPWIQRQIEEASDARNPVGVSRE